MNLLPLLSTTDNSPESLSNNTRCYRHLTKFACKFRGLIKILIVHYSYQFYWKKRLGKYLHVVILIDQATQAAARCRYLFTPHLRGIRSLWFFHISRAVSECAKDFKNIEDRKFRMGEYFAKVILFSAILSNR